MSKQGAKQKYIPGLTKRPDDSEFPPPVYEETEDDILIREFLAGIKNATMALHEYCSRNKIKLEFQDERLDPFTSQIPNGFAVRIFLNGLAYPQGQGINKKEAKNMASTLAFRAYLNIDDYSPVEHTPELDDSRFQEVRDLLDIVHQKNLVYKKSIRQDMVTCITVYTLDIGGLETIKVESMDQDEAIVQAHRKALQKLTGKNLFDTVPNPAAFPGAVDTSLYPNPALALQWAQKTEAALDRLLQPFPPEFRELDHHVAAIFMTDVSNTLGEMVAIATGNSSISASNLTVDGRCLIDSSCTTVAVRALRKYLAQQMLNCYASQKSIFHKARGCDRLSLHDGVCFNLFLSHPPDGDYREALPSKSSFDLQQTSEIESGGHIPTFSDDVHALFRCRNEEGGLETTNQTPDQLSVEDVQHANEMRVMSCSDKLLRWNILGVQGAALFHFTDPIYFKSIALGFHPMNDHGHLSRAVCCRVYNDLAESLPLSFVIHHPVLHFCPSPIGNPQEKKLPTDLSINWCGTDAKLEVVEGNRGRTHTSSPFKVSANGASRLSKAGMHLKWFSDLCKANRGAKMSLLQGGPTRAQVKAAATDYQIAKKAFLDHCATFDIGKWIHAPLEMSMFSS